MKRKKALSVILAACLVLSLAAMTGLAAEPRAAYAGRTMRGLVIVVDEDGNATQREVEVAVPAAASQKQQDELVKTVTMNTVASVTGKAMPRGGSQWDIISESTTSILVEGHHNAELVEGTLAENYESVVVQLSGILPVGFPYNDPIYELNVNIMSDKSPGQYADQTFAFEVGRDFNVLFHSNSTSVSMRKGSTITARAHTDKRGIEIQTCRLWGVPYA